MADKIVMGYWDCPYCSHEQIEGTIRTCPHCGKPRGETTAFYMIGADGRKISSLHGIKDTGQVTQNNRYLTEEESAKKGKGSDWYCPYCDSLNSALDIVCTSCGHPREETDADYFEKKEEVEQKAAQKEQPPIQPVQSKKKSNPLIFVGIGAVLLLLLISALSPKEKKLHVEHKLWQYQLEIEQYKELHESDWELPEGAELERTANEIHHYDSVLDHYETRTREYTVQEPDGSHTEYDYVDNGDGTFSERSYQVTDYKTVTKYETYEDPVYVQVPRYQTKYYYSIWRWVYERTEETSGTDDEPYFASPVLGDDERTGTQTKQYWIEADTGKKTQQYEVTEEIWQKIRKGSDIKAKISGKTIRELED